MFTALLPKGAPFFELLQQQNSIFCSMTAALADTFEDNSTTRGNELRQSISEQEAEADQIYVSVTRHLSRTFITPIDREDILRINKAQEEAIDLVHNLSTRFNLLELSPLLPPMLELGRNIKNMALLIQSMLDGLAHKKDSHNTTEFRKLREQCEMLLRQGIRNLYDLEEPVLAPTILHIVKWTRGYDRMEAVVEQIVELAEIIEEAVLKNV